MPSAFLRLVGVVTSVLACNTASGHVAKPVQYCWQPSTTASNLVTHLRKVVSSSDTGWVRHRSMYGLLAADSSDVSAVIDEATCRQASVVRLLRNNPPDTSTVYPVLLIRAGINRYVVYDGATRGGDYEAYFVFDSTFALVKIFAS